MLKKMLLGISQENQSSSAKIELLNIIIMGWGPTEQQKNRQVVNWAQMTTHGSIWHEEKWASCRLDTLPMMPILHLITAHRVVSALTTGHGSSAHVHNRAPCRLDKATLVTSGHQKTMHRIGYAQTTRESAVHRCNCAAATQNSCNSKPTVLIASVSAFKTMELKSTKK